MSVNFIKSLKYYDVIYITGETGSGKSNTIPKLILYLFEKVIKINAYVLPKRLSVIKNLLYFSKSLGCTIGKKIGVKMRYYRLISGKTKLLYMTEALILSDLLNCTFIKKFNIIIIDEAHERSIQNDILVGLLINIQKYFKTYITLIFVTATMDFLRISDLNIRCHFIVIIGSRFLKNINYLKKNIKNYLLSSLQVLLNVLEKDCAGTIMIFFSGRNEIIFFKFIISLLLHKKSNKKFVNILTFYSNFINDSEIKHNNIGYKNLILATNFAETSLTVKDLKYIIDSGFLKIKTYTKLKNNGFLKKVVAFKINNKQRIDIILLMSGRLCDGKVFRLFSKNSYSNNNCFYDLQYTQDCLDHFVLFLKIVKFEYFEGLELLNRIDKDKLSKSLESLKINGCLDKNYKVRKLCRIMILFPISLKNCISVFESILLGCSSNLLNIISVLNAQNLSNSFYYHTKMPDIQIRSRKYQSEAFTIGLSFLIYQRIPKKIRYIWSKRLKTPERLFADAFKLLKLLKMLLYRINIKVTTSTSLNLIDFCIFRGNSEHIAINIKEKLYFSVYEKNIIKLRFKTHTLFNSHSTMHKMPLFVIYQNLTFGLDNYMDIVTIIKRIWLIFDPNFCTRVLSYT